MSIQKLLTKASITLFALLLWHVAGDTNAPCYYPSGDTATGYFACLVQDAYISTCCQQGWTCLSNSLCVVTNPAESSNLNLPIGTSERGACTDPKWSSEVCGGFCLREIPQAICSQGSLTVIRQRRLKRGSSSMWQQQFLLFRR